MDVSKPIPATARAHGPPRAGLGIPAPSEQRPLPGGRGRKLSSLPGPRESGSEGGAGEAQKAGREEAEPLQHF